MLGFENTILYKDRLVELDTTDKYIMFSNGSLPCGPMRESGATYNERIALQNYYNLASTRGCGILAEGDSMVDVGIEDGDELMVDPCRFVQNGSVVVACYENEMTVKTYYQDPDTGTIMLVPQNRAKGYPPIVIEHPEKLRLCGVVAKISRVPLRVSSWQLRQRLQDYNDDKRLEEILERTIEAGYMSSDQQWLPNVKREFKAVWIELVADRVGIADRWSWADTHWALGSLRQCLYRVKGTVRYDELFKQIKPLLA